MTCVQFDIPAINFLAALPEFAIENFLIDCINDCYDTNIDLNKLLGLYGVNSVIQLLDTPGVGIAVNGLVGAFVAPILYVVDLICKLLNFDFNFSFDWPPIILEWIRPYIKFNLPAFNLTLPTITFPILNFSFDLPEFEFDFGFDLPFFTLPDLTWILQLLALLFNLPALFIDWLLSKIICPGSLEELSLDVNTVLDWIKSILQPIAFPDLPNISIDEMISGLPWLCAIKCLVGKLLGPINEALGAIFGEISLVPDLLEGLGVIDECGCIIPLVQLFPGFNRPCTN